jgi:sugar-specific transcriptional regulator TrmB
VVARTQQPELEPRGSLLESLHKLGFSQYEARCYVGLLNQEPQTGYSVAKATGVPQPKVYEALRKLVGRGAAYEIAGDPVRFVPVAPARLLDQLEAEVSSQFSAARQAAATLVDVEPARFDLLKQLSGRDAVIDAAVSLIREAGSRVYASAGVAELADVEGPLRAAADRGTDIVVLCFGQMPFDDPRLRVYRHASTDGVLFRHHQAKHLAVIADSRATVWGLAVDGRQWTAIQTENELVIAALKGFIRHDIDLQQVFADFGPDLVRRYGQGLEGLERYRQQPARTADELSGAAGTGGRSRRTS